MKLPSLKITNFLTITDAEISLADRGLTLIQGINNDDTSADSNGAGKSSIADALCWALYGVTARGVSGDDVVNDKAGKGTIVEVLIDDNLDQYRISRHRKHKTGKNGLKVVKIETGVGGAVTEHDLTKGTDKLTQEIVDKILGSSLDVFKASICAGQEQMPDLPAMTDKNLKMLLEEASGLTLLEAAYTEARDRLGKAKSAVDQAQMALARHKFNHDAQVGQRATTEERVKGWELQRQQRITGYRQYAQPLMTTINQMKGELAKINGDALKTALEDLGKQLASLGAQTQKLVELERKVVQTGAQLQNAKQRVQIAYREHTGAERALQDVEHKIGCPCTECGRPLSKTELAAATKAADARAQEKAKELAQAALDVAKAEQDVLQAVAERDSFKATIIDTSALDAAMSDKQAQLKARDDLARSLQSHVERAKRLGEDIAAATAEVNPYNRMVEQIEAAILVEAAKVSAAQAALDAAQSEFEISNAVVAVFAPAGVRAVVLDDVTPFLNQQTSKYLATLSDSNIEATWTTLVKNSKGDLREKFSIEVENAKGAKSFAGLSGGEKRKVRIATALALQDLVATRAVKPIDLFIGDEIDDALDPAGLERLTQILDEKARERGTVLVISHNDLQDWISNIIQIEKMPGGQTKVNELTA